MLAYIPSLFSSLRLKPAVLATTAAILTPALLPAICVIEEDTKLTASNGANQDYFGEANAVHNGVAIVGAPRDGFDNEGAAYIYRHNGTDWIEEEILIPSTPSASGFFGTSVAIYDDIAVVGSLEHDLPMVVTGAAYIFRYDGMNWVEEQKITLAAPEAGDRFGISVGVFKETVIVGADHRTAGGFDDSGAVYVYEYHADSGTWLGAGDLPRWDPSVDSFFGYSIAITDGFIIVGAWEDNQAGNNAGAAYIFFNHEGAWNQYQKLIPAEVTVGDRFGGAVDIEGHVAVVGAQWNDPTGDDRGAAWVFELGVLGTDWMPTRITASDAEPFDRFGIDVAVSGTNVLVGSFDDAPGNLSGAAYLYGLTNAGWTERAKFEPSDLDPSDQFGTHLAMDGDWAIAGAHLEDSVAPTAGAAYAFAITDLVLDVDQDTVLPGGTVDFTVCGGFDGHGGRLYIAEVDGLPDSEGLTGGTFGFDGQWSASIEIPASYDGSLVGLQGFSYNETWQTIASNIDEVDVN